MIGMHYVRKVAGRYLTHERFVRNLDPFYRKFQKEMYGGREWMNIILAIGDIDEFILGKMNMIVEERTEEARAKATPLQQRRDHQLPRRDRTRLDCQGVTHKVSEGKTLRAEAKKKDKEVEQAEEAWQSGRYWGNWEQWEELLAARTYAWDEAIRSTPTTVPLHHRRAATDAAMALASTQGLGGHHIILF